MTFEKLQQDMIAAMKARDADRKEVLSNLVSAAKKAAIDKQCRDNITEEIVDAAILKELKTAKEQIDTCPAEREELMAKYKYNYDVIASYAPQMMSEEEIRATLEKDFADVIATKNKGQIMKTIMPAFKGKADGKLINQIVADLCK
ncbi:MAG: GatB/YqeY domain-containing protein [Lachnospiraceae bacterium]|nr:GatB/YqeY domain-containing protein [Lachnospiraceae bacterium]